ncbi:MAG: putative NEK protein kinase [Streblomastix strix]|uniref:non-specific serine/threonine protein kinase n=1 Tax=Streblomastix strix TaxID=222440 RepID=A0A5J4VGI3_9EUKA|nr:MAG: putative NEK protein kinase [Streblomastix strix]
MMREIYEILVQASPNQFIHVVEPLGFFLNDDGDKGYIVMEFCSEGDLRRYINDMKRKGTEISDLKAWEMIAQVASSLIQLHANGIIHGDLKPENILLTEEIKVKLSDFGLARQLQEGKDYLTLRAGTKLFLAPELLQYQKGKENAGIIKRMQTTAADIWSIGIMLFELLAQHHPFMNLNEDQDPMAESETLHRIIEQEAPEIPAHYPESMRMLIKSMLNKDSVRRITAEAILAIPEVAANLTHK